MRKFSVLVITLLFILHFSPQTADAKEVEDTAEKEIEETEQVDSDEDNYESSDVVTSKEDEVIETSEHNNAEDSSNETDENNRDIDQDESSIQSSSSIDVITEDEIFDDRVIELRDQLNILGFPTTDDPEEHYGESTQETVEKFQEYYDLEKVSEIGLILEQLESILSTPLQQGESHEDVVQLKKDLVALGFGDFNFNQNYGSTTVATVKEFQAFYKLKENGIVDTRTQEKLNKLLSTPMQRGDYRKDAIILKEKLAKLGFIVSSNPTPQYGPSTERNVKDFQEYYGLNEVSGVADQATLDKLDELVSTPLQRGERHEDVIQLKKGLVALGFGSFNFNQNYGSTTEAAVEEFQKYYELQVNGIADERTLDKLDSILDTPLKRNGRDESVTQLKRDLVTLGFGDFNFNQNYGSTTEATVKEFQAFYKLKENGIVDTRTQEKLDELLETPMQRDDYRRDAIMMKEKLAKLGFVVSSNPTPQYGPSTERNVREFQEYYGLKDVTGIADQPTLDKLDELLSTPLQDGGRHEDVVKLKEDLATLGFGDFNFNQNYLSKTVRKVEEFQAYYGLRVNGIADERTLDKLDSILDTPLKRGGRDESVTQLKKDLVTLGFGDFNFNQNYGSTTEATVKEFQAFYDLKAHGVVDYFTQDKLDELLDNPMQRGDYRKDVITLKEKLAKLGFVVSSNPTPQYGPSTERNVREFQDYYGLENVTGIADSDTLEKLDELLSTPLQRGGRHEDVIQLKKDLVALGFGTFNFNQNYGSTTKATVAEFQAYYGLRVNGIADPRTLDEIQKVLNSPFREGQVHDDVIQLKQDLDKWI